MYFKMGFRTSFYDAQPLSVITVMSLALLTMKSFFLGLLWNMYPCLVRIFWASPRHWATCCKLAWFWTGCWTRSLLEFPFNLYHSVLQVTVTCVTSYFLFSTFFFCPRQNLWGYRNQESAIEKKKLRNHRYLLGIHSWLTGKSWHTGTSTRYHTFLLLAAMTAGSHRLSRVSMSRKTTSWASISSSSLATSCWACAIVTSEKFTGWPGMGMLML